jgi:hypothetical protein
MSNNDIDKAYVSPIDQFLYKYDRDHAKTASQLREIKRHQLIAYLRDNPNPQIVEEIWEEF